MHRGNGTLCGCLELVERAICMIWAEGSEHHIRIAAGPEWLCSSIPLATRVLVTHLFGAVGGVASVSSRSVAEVAGTSHGLSIPSPIGVPGQGYSSHPDLVIAHSLEPDHLPISPHRSALYYKQHRPLVYW